MRLARARTGRAGQGRPAGVVHWITGLPCAGKTTVGEALLEQMRNNGVDALLLDGDALRKTFPNRLGFRRQDRLVAAGRYSRLSRRLSLEGTNVVVCTVSMYAEVWKWNREHLPRYFEVYLQSPRSLRVARDRKGIYAGSNVPGDDLAVDEPHGADLQLRNEGPETPGELAGRIWAASPLARVET